LIRFLKNILIPVCYLSSPKNIIFTISLFYHKTMISADFLQSELFLYLILPLLIMFSRIIDQSIGIVRIIFATKGYKGLALVAGFIESLVWLLAISQIMQQLNNIFCYIAFAAGFALGNYIGIYIENKLTLGNVIVRVVFQFNADQTIALLRENNFRLTILDAYTFNGPVKMIFSTIKKSDLKKFLALLKENNPMAFYTVEDVKMVKEGFFPTRSSIFKRNKS